MNFDTVVASSHQSPSLVLFLGMGSAYLCKRCFGEKAGDQEYIATTNVEGKAISLPLDIHDDVSKSSNDSSLLRKVERSRVIIMSFAMEEQSSLFDIMDKWHPLLTNKSSQCTTILVGVRTNPEIPPSVKQSQGRGLSKILECSYIEVTTKEHAEQVKNSIIAALPAKKPLHNRSKSLDKDKRMYKNRAIRRKKAKITLQWCRSATLIDLVAAKDKHYNLHVLEDSTMSPFAAALLEGNTNAADFFLKQEKGVADFSNMLMDTLPKALLDWCNSEESAFQPIKDLNLSNNRLNYVPLCFKDIEKVHLHGNPLLCLPPEIRKAKWARVQEYLRSVDSTGNVSWNVRKVLILGEEGCGKTTLTNCLSSKSGKTDVSVNLSTDGITMTEIQLKERNAYLDKRKQKKKYTINLWDFGGQIIYYPTHQFFLSAHSAYIIVFDYSEVKWQRLEYWFKQLKAQCSTSVIAILAGTHIDCCSEETIHDMNRRLLAQFPRQQYPFFLGEIFPVSCSSGVGIQELKTALLRLCENTLLTPNCPVTWSYFYNLLYSYSRVGIDRVSWPEFDSWAKSCGITKEEELIKATELLETSGVLVHLQHPTESLQMSQVILSAQWLADIMACFITTRANFVNNGILQMEDIPRVLSDKEKFPPVLYDSILSLLEKFHIIYRMEKRYIIPSMLPISRPGSELSSCFPCIVSPLQNTIGRVFQFPSLPLGFFERLEVSLFSHPGLEIMITWRSGTLLKGENCQLLVEYNDTTYELFILFRYTFASYTKTLPIFSNILSTIANMIFGFYPGLNECTKESILCPHCVRLGVDYESAWRFCKRKVITILEQEEPSLLHCNDLQGISRAVNPLQAAPDLSLSYSSNIIPASAVTIGKMIGEGGAGAVYDGEIAGTRVAIKQLHIKQTHDHMIKYTEFLSEVSVMTSLDHPNIVKLYGVLETPKAMVLEFVGGGDLFELLHPEEVSPRQKPLESDDLSWTQRMIFAYNISSGLAYLQSVSPPIVHRDLRSPNIFLSDDKKSALIGDFGMALHVNNEVGGTLKTWQWLAPEVISPESSGYNEKSDTFSLGIILWELLTLKIPYDEFLTNPKYFHSELQEWKLQEIKAAIIEEGLRPTIPADCPPFYREIIEGCWKHSPQDRMSSIEITRILEREYSFLKTQRRHAGSLVIPVVKKEMITRADSFTSCNSVREQDIYQLDEHPSCMLTVSSSLLVGTKSGNIFVFTLNDITTGAEQISLRGKLIGHHSPVSMMVFTGIAVWSCARDGTMSVWEPDESGCFQKSYQWNPLITSVICPSCMVHVHHSSYGDTIWLGSGSEGKITVWDANLYKCIATITSEHILQCNRILSYGDYVLVAGRLGVVSIFCKKTRAFLGSFEAHSTQITAMVMVRQSNEFWTACNTGELAMWYMTCVEDLRQVGNSTLHKCKVLDLFHVQQFKQCFSLAFDGSICCWDIKSKQPVAEISQCIEKPVGLSGTLKGYLWTTSTCAVQLWPFDWSNQIQPVSKK